MMNKFISFLLLTVLLTNCSPGVSQETPFPSETTTQDTSIAPTQTPLPTQAAAPFAFVRDGSPLPVSSETISVENANSLQVLARYGYGYIQSRFHTYDESTFIVQTSVAVHGYAPGTVNEIWRYDPGVTILEVEPALTQAKIALGRADGVIVILDAADGRELVSWKSDASGITNLAFSSDDSMLASAGYDDIARVWDLASGAEVRNFPFSNATEGTELFFLKEDKQLAVAEWGYSGDTYSFLDIQTGEVISELALVASDILAFNPGNESYLAYVGAHLAFVDLDGQVLKEFEALPEDYEGWGPLSVHFSQDRSLLAIGLVQMVALWDTESGELQSILGAEETAAHPGIAFFSPLTRSGPGPSGIYSIDITSDNKFLVATDGYGNVTIWNLDNQQVHNTAYLRARGTFLSPDEQALLSVSGSEFSIITFPGLKRTDSIALGGGELVFSPDGGQLAYGANIWDVNSGAVSPIPFGERVLSFSETGNTIFTIQPEWMLRGRLLSDLSINRSVEIQIPVVEDEYWDDYMPYAWYEMGSWALSPNSQILAGWAYDTPMLAWDATSGDYAFNVSLSWDDFLFSPNSQYVMNSWNQDVYLYEIGNSAAEEIFHVALRGYEHAKAFSPDSQELWIIDATGFQVFSTESGERLVKQPFNRELEPTGLITVNMDENLIVFSNDDCYDREDTGCRISSKVSFYDTEAQILVEWFDEDDWGFSIIGLAFSPDGKWLATLGNDGIIRVWGVPAQ